MSYHSKSPEASVPEEEVIEVLLKSSQRFRTFYEVERKRISGSLHWIQDPAMPEGIDYRYTRRVSDGQMLQFIRLRRFPAISEEAFKIAHELEHAVMATEGYPSTGATSQYEKLSSALNSMVHDPLVNSRLQAFGFDPRHDYEAEVQEHFRQLEGVARSPSERLTELLWMFNYVGDILSWELLSSNTECSPFQEWFDARHPYIARRGQKLLAMVRRVGYDTPAKMSELFREIIRRYRIENILRLG
jgi:hypothetical protein